METCFSAGFCFAGYLTSLLSKIAKILGAAYWGVPTIVRLSRKLASLNYLETPKSDNLYHFYLSLKIFEGFMSLWAIWNSVCNICKVFINTLANSISFASEKGIFPAIALLISS
jgi:hypothetical protein